VGHYFWFLVKLEQWKLLTLSELGFLTVLMQLIRESGVHRDYLSKRLGLSRPTLNKYITKLIDLRLIKEQRFGNHKLIMLQFGVSDIEALYRALKVNPKAGLKDLVKKVDIHILYTYSLYLSKKNKTRQTSKTSEILEASVKKVDPYDEIADFVEDVRQSMLPDVKIIGLPPKKHYRAVKYLMQTLNGDQFQDVDDYVRFYQDVMKSDRVGFSWGLFVHDSIRTRFESAKSSRQKKYLDSNPQDKYETNDDELLTRMALAKARKAGNE